VTRAANGDREAAIHRKPFTVHPSPSFYIRRCSAVGGSMPFSRM
jgi:hypothetical protein